MNNSIQFKPMKRGDTPTFLFRYSAPSVGFDWSTVLADFAMTDVSAPNNNDGAGVLRIDVVLTTDADNRATLLVTPTILESKALTPSTKYFVEAQLKQSGTLVTTPITGTIKVLQDYVI